MVAGEKVPARLTPGRPPVSKEIIWTLVTETFIEGAAHLNGVAKAGSFIRHRVDGSVSVVF